MDGYINKLESERPLYMHQTPLVPRKSWKKLLNLILTRERFETCIEVLVFFLRIL